MREKGNWYCLSKTLAEELAWKMTKEEDSPFNLVTINPVRFFHDLIKCSMSLNFS
jgi:hypothetical protein